jgi:hypothetical protein
MKPAFKSHIVACIFFAAITLGSDYSFFASEAFAQTPTPAQTPVQAPVASNQNNVVSGSIQRREYTLLEPLPCVNGPEGTVTEGITCENGYVKKVNLYAILGYAYRLLLALASILAVVMIMYGGVQYMTTEAFTGKSEAKETIKNAVIGLFMTLGSFLFLQTIDPKITELAQDPLPPIGVDRENIFDPQTLDQLLKNETARIQNLQKAAIQQAEDDKKASESLSDVSSTYKNQVSKTETELAAYKISNPTDIAGTKEIQDQLKLQKRNLALAKSESAVIENFGSYYDALLSVKMPATVEYSSTAWNPNESIFDNRNIFYAGLEIPKRKTKITAPYETALASMTAQNDVEGSKAVQDRKQAIISLADFARDTIDLEKRYEKYAVRVATQGARPSTFATANQPKLQGLINGMLARTTSTALKTTFGAGYETDITAQFYKKNLDLYRQRLENIKATYK